VLTSYDTFRELRAASLSDNDLTSLLQATAKQLLSYVEGGPEPTLHIRR
jgi:hypothetical protein